MATTEGEHAELADELHELIKARVEDLGLDWALVIIDPQDEVDKVQTYERGASQFFDGPLDLYRALVRMHEGRKRRKEVS